MSSLRRVLVVTSVLVLVSLGLRTPFMAQATRIGIPVQRDRWGVALQTDRPFYAVGEEVHTVWRLPNGTPFDAFGVALSSGGNGCTYRLTIRDAAGQTVWQPGSIVNGQFSGPGCAFGEFSWNLFAGTSTSQARTLPLVYQNAGGISVLGAPLPAGFYSVTLELYFHGPHAVPVSGKTLTGGLSHAASVPIQVL